MNSPHKGQWRGALVFSLICTWKNGWVNNREADDLRRYHTHYDVIVMIQMSGIKPLLVSSMTRMFVSLFCHSQFDINHAIFDWHFAHVLTILYCVISLVDRAVDKWNHVNPSCRRPDGDNALEILQSYTKTSMMLDIPTDIHVMMIIFIEAYHVCHVVSYKVIIQTTKKSMLSKFPYWHAQKNSC